MSFKLVKHCAKIRGEAIIRHVNYSNADHFSFRMMTPPPAPRYYITRRTQFLWHLLGVALLVSATPTYGANFTTDEWCGLSATEGTIKAGDDGRLKALLKLRKEHPARDEHQAMPGCHIDLRTDGGDVETAMAMGRLIRNGDPWVVHAIRCRSACVFLFAAGVQRIVLNDADGSPGVLAVHRMYYSDLDSRMSVQAIQENYKKRLVQVRAYLDQMNVASDFLDFMQSFPPEEMHAMTEDELNRYGIGYRDPVWDEHEMALLAKRIGVSSQEARRRQMRVDSECIAKDTSEPAIHDYGVCSDAIMEDVSPSVIRRREAVLEQARESSMLACGDFDNNWPATRQDEYVTCFKREMVKRGVKQ